MKIWIRAEQLASVRTPATQEFLGPETMKAADDSMNEAVAALKAGKLNELKARWYPYG